MENTENIKNGKTQNMETKWKSTVNIENATDGKAKKMEIQWK